MSESRSTPASDAPERVLYKLDTGPIPLDVMAVNPDGKGECWYRIPSWRVHFDYDALRDVDIRLHRSIASSAVWTLTEATTGFKMFGDLAHDYYIGDEGSMLAEFCAGYMLKLTKDKVTEALKRARQALTQRTDGCRHQMPPLQRGQAMTNNPAQLRSAATALLSAAEMLEHNDAIFKGKWKKGSKAWSGDFIERTVADGLALLTPRSESEESKDWLIWSNEHRAWWGPERCGYPHNFVAAGRYTLTAARAICRSRHWADGKTPPETMIHIDEVDHANPPRS